MPVPEGPEPNVWLPIVLSALGIPCCWPLSIVFLVFSIVAAVQKSNGNWTSARTFSKVGLIGGGTIVGLGFVGCVVYAVLMVIAASASP